MKYELTSESQIVNGHTLYRIRALKKFSKKFSNVRVGDLGGWIEKVENLSQENNCWVYNNARVYGNALVYGAAEVFGAAEVYGDARVFGDAWVYGNARVYGNASVYGNARVYSNARVSGDALVYGNTSVYDNARVYGDALVYGNARVYEGQISEGIRSEENPDVISNKATEIKEIKEEIKVVELEIIKPKIIGSIHWLDVSTE